MEAGSRIKVFSLPRMHLEIVAHRIRVFSAFCAPVSLLFACRIDDHHHRLVSRLSKSAVSGEGQSESHQDDRNIKSDLPLLD